MRQIVTNALQYWEPRRLIYNAVLAAIVFTYFLVALPEAKHPAPLNVLFVLFILAVLANICYCSVYIVDVFLQASGFRTEWLRWRWLLLVLGTCFAGVITHFFALGLFVYPHGD